jgi:hypothetical protein
LSIARSAMCRSNPSNLTFLSKKEGSDGDTSPR